MNQPTARELFDFIAKQVHEHANRTGIQPYRAFPRWFAEMYFTRPEGMISSDGVGDGKVDLFFHMVSGKAVTHNVINSKFTETYGQIAPVDFYDEVLAFYELFNQAAGRGKFIQMKVKAELRPYYKKLFEAHDAGKANLIFLTNCGKNVGQFAKVEKLAVTTFHLEDLIQHVLDDLDGAMPRTPDLVLQQISTTLSPKPEETGVSTTIVFARLCDFVEYMENDPFNLLFARNVRVSQGNTIVNQAIRRTFLEHPEQFAYSNNGLTLLCEDVTHTPLNQELRLINPRVVNGCQTLHSIYSAFDMDGSDLSSKARKARVMIRIVCVPPPKGVEGPAKASENKQIINRISIRSNQQNPIRPWNLRSNDDFQMDLARRFRQADLFYERRDKEWNSRSTHLKSVGVARGPSIKKMIAYTACYYWKNSKLGPSLAKGHLGEIFQGDGYEIISEQTEPELAYQIFIVADISLYSLRLLAQKKYTNSRAHIDFVILSLVFRLLSEMGAAWNKLQFTNTLELQWEDLDSYVKPWFEIIRTAADRVLDQYEKVTNRAKHKNCEDLTLRNFVRRKEEMQKILKGPFSRAQRSSAGSILRVT